MDRNERKAAIAAYKERKPAWGIYAVICSPTGQTWVGQSRHIDTQCNGLWFSLRQGKNRHAALQAAWNEHGEPAFRFEELERLSDDLTPIGRLDALKRQQALWLAELKGTAL